jgi:hypothetical protein
VPAQHRKRVLGGVAIAVVEGDRRERPSRAPQAQGHLVEGDEIEAELDGDRERAVEELRGDLEQPVRRESAFAPGPDVMEHEDRAAALRDRTQPAVGSKRRGRGEPGREQAMLQRTHAGELMPAV